MSRQKKDKGSPINSQAEETQVTISLSKLKALMKTIATEVFDDKKEKLREEIEDECEYKVYIQSVEIEQTFEKFKEDLKSRAETIDFKKIAKEQCITTTKSELKSTTEEIEALKTVNARMKRKLERLEFALSCKDAKIEQLKTKMDEIEQNQYNRSVRIMGMPEDEGEESDIKSIQNIAKEKFEMNLKTTDVAEAYRVGRVNNKRKSRDVIVKFKKKSVRDQFYANRRKLIPGHDYQNIYVNELLTEHRANLFFAARKLVKSKKLHSAWSQRGNILIRKVEADKPKEIKLHKQLEEITGEFGDEAEQPLCDDNYHDSCDEDD